MSWSREGAGFTEFLQVEQSWPAFGVRAALARAGVSAIAAADADRDARLWRLQVDAMRLVAQWQAAQSRASATAADADAADRLVDQLRVREREGEGSRLDRLRAEQELAELRDAAVAAAVELEGARGAVLALLPPGLDVARVADPGPAALAPPVDLDRLIDRARATRPEIRALRAAETRSGLEAEAARFARRPAPVLSGGLKRADNDGERQIGGVVGLSVTVPLFDAGARDAARWTAEGTRLAAERLALEREVRLEITNAASALDLRRRALARAAIDPAAEELVTTAEVAYREGEAGLLVLLDAVRTAARARMRALERRLELRLAEIAVERAVGEVLWP